MTERNFYISFIWNEINFGIRNFLKVHKVNIKILNQWVCFEQVTMQKQSLDAVSASLLKKRQNFCLTVSLLHAVPLTKSLQ